MPFESIELNLRRNRIPYFSLRDKQQEKRKIKNKLKQFNKLLNSMHLNFRKIEIDLYDGADDFELKINRNKIPQNKSAKIICQNLKDTGLISHRLYKQIREALEPIAKLPSLSTCIKYKKKVDNIWPIAQNEFGSYIIDPKAKITYVCEKYIKNLKRYILNKRISYI